MAETIIQKLHKDIDSLLELNVTFHNNFSYGKSSWAQWGEYQEWINYNILSMRTIKNLSAQAFYRDAFILTRSVFESYFLIKLSMLATYVYFNYIPRSGENKHDLFQRVKNEAENIFGKENVKSIKAIPNTNKVEVVYRIKPIKGTEKIVPRHYYFFKEYDADSYYLSEISFGDNYGTRERKKTRKKFNKDINQNFLNMPNAVLRYLEINKMATKRQRDATLVHYNFLSKFTHGSASSYEILSGNREKAYLERLDDLVLHDHINELLILLYVCHLAIYYIELQIEYFSGEKEIKIKNLDKIKEYIAEVKEKYNFFWFIYNQPSTYDEYNHKMQKIFSGKEPTLRGKSEIKYYRNPISRLKDVRTPKSNQAIGKYYPPAILNL